MWGCVILGVLHSHNRRLRVDPSPRLPECGDSKLQNCTLIPAKLLGDHRTQHSFVYDKELMLTEPRRAVLRAIKLLA